MESDWEDTPGQEKTEILRWRSMSRNGWKGLSQVSQGCLFGSAALKVVHWRTLISLQDMHMVHLQIFKE